MSTDSNKLHKTNSYGASSYTNKRDKLMGNGVGDIVDNKEGENPIRDTSKVYNVGSNLKGVGGAPSLMRSSYPKPEVVEVVETKQEPEA